MFFKHIFKLNQSQVDKLKQVIGNYRNQLDALEAEGNLETWNNDFEDVVYDITEDFLTVCGQDEADVLYAYKHQAKEGGTFFYTYEANLENLVLNTPEIQSDLKPYYKMDGSLIPLLLGNNTIIRIDSPQATGSLQIVFGLEEQVFQITKPSRC